MKKNKLVTPFLKWVGGKRQIIDILKHHFPKKYNCYYEPFLGGGAVLLEIQPDKAVVNDINKELINLYLNVKDNVEELISELKSFSNTEEYFYKVRGWDRDEKEYEKFNSLQKAARIHYLNKTCYNGLFRVNRAGQFNSPFGKYKNPNIVNEIKLRAVSRYLNNADIVFTSTDFTASLIQATKGDFVYLDPPYDLIDESANFTGYTKSGFNRNEQSRVRDICIELDKKGVKFLLSNSNTAFIREEYSMFKIDIIKAKRIINSVATERGEIEEVLIKNYE